MVSMATCEFIATLVVPMNTDTNTEDTVGVGGINSISVRIHIARTYLHK